MGFINNLLTKFKTLASVVWGDICNTYQRTKVVLLAVVGIIIYFEWNKIKEKLLVKSGADEIKSDQKQDQALAQQAQRASDQGDQLQQQANQLADQEQPVKEDWYKDKK